MDLWAVAAGFGAGLIGGFMGGSITGWFSGWQYQTQLGLLNKKVNEIWGMTYSQKGVDAREQNAAAEAALLGQAMELFKSEDPEKMKKLAALAASNPAMAMRIMKKLGISL